VPKRAHQTAPRTGASFDHEHDRGGVFATDRKALDEAQRDHECRRGHADLIVSGQQTDEERRHRHRDDRERECARAAVAIADMAEQKRANRTHQEAGGEHAERVDQRRGAAMRGEKVLADRGREESVD